MSPILIIDAALAGLFTYLAQTYWKDNHKKTAIWYAFCGVMNIFTTLCNIP